MGELLLYFVIIAVNSKIVKLATSLHILMHQKFNQNHK